MSNISCNHSVTGSPHNFSTIHQDFSQVFIHFSSSFCVALLNASRRITWNCIPKLQIISHCWEVRQTKLQEMKKGGWTQLKHKRQGIKWKHDSNFRLLFAILIQTGQQQWDCAWLRNKDTHYQNADLNFRLIKCAMIDRKSQ